MGFFICSLALFITYFVDKYALLRVWRPAPMIGRKVAAFGREHFYVYAVLALIFCAAYLYAMFPFDNLCETDVEAGSLYAGTYNITKVDSDDGPDIIEVTVSEDDPTYKYWYVLHFIKYVFKFQTWAFNFVTFLIIICYYYISNQNVFHTWHFPLTSDVQDKANGDKWMNSEQEEMVDFFGWSGFGLFLFILTLKLYSYVMSYFEGNHVPFGEDQNIPLSQVRSKAAYVPQVRTDYYAYPLMTCSVGDRATFNGIRNSGRRVQKCSLLDQFPYEIRWKARDQTKPILSFIKYYSIKSDGLKYEDRR